MMQSRPRQEMRWPMQSNTDITRQAHLVADAGDPTTEVFVIDEHFKRIAKGHGRIDTALPAGIYKVKFAAGSLIRELCVPLEANRDVVEVSPPDLSFSTSAPIKQTRTSHDYHEDSASQLSKKVHRPVGTGSQLFVFVRDLEKQGWDDPSTGLTLHDLTGNLLVDFTKDGEREIANPETDHWAGCTVELDPGSYRLRVQIGAGEILEQIIVTCADWQTQVFLLRQLYGSTQQVLRADLGHASVLMVPIGKGFQPERPGFRQAELARQGLVRG